MIRRVLENIKQAWSNRARSVATDVHEHYCASIGTQQEQGRVWKFGEEVQPIKLHVDAKDVTLGCPNCRCAGFHLGPEGGMSQNVECVDCHHRWNTNPHGMPWQFIGLGDDYNQVRVAAKFAARHRHAAVQ